MSEEKEVKEMNLSEVVEIDKEEEAKLQKFLNKLNANIEGDKELEDLLGGTVNKWIKEIDEKSEPKKE